jgi:hypothetical protein
MQALQALELTKPIIIRGRYMFDRQLWIRFYPYDKPGFWWRPKANEEPIPITSKIAKHEVVNRFSRIILQYKGEELHFYEHIGALRATGLTGVVIDSTKHPPYFGRVLEMWEELAPFCRPIPDENIPWVKIDSKSIIKSNGISGSGDVSFLPHNDPFLGVKIIINYEEIGRIEKEFKLPMGIRELEKLFKPCSLAFPVDFYYSCMYYFSKVLSNTFPLYKSTTWAHKFKGREDLLLEMIAFHRFVDTVGDATLIHHEALPAGIIVSRLGGHKADMELLKEMRNKPLQIIPDEIR